MDREDIKTMIMPIWIGLGLAVLIVLLGAYVLLA